MQYSSVCSQFLVILASAYTPVSAVNTSGVPRLTKFYSPIHQSAQTLVEKIYALVSGRPAGLCNFLDAPELEAFLKPKDGDGEKLRVVYRSYATLHFVFVVDSAESELSILDLIQVRRAWCSSHSGVGDPTRPS